MRTRFRRAAIAAVAAFVLLAPGWAGAQSFDCGKARAPDETAVCASRDLGNLDTRMATLWWVLQQVPMMMGQRGALRDAQAAFLQQRAACGADTACLTPVYEARIAAMEQQVKANMQTFCKAIQLC